MSLKNVSLIAFLGLLFGCAGVNPKNFSPVAVQSLYALKEDVTYIALEANAFHPDIINGLAKGEYVALFEDDSHVYYVGDGGCVLPFKDRGGIAIPKDGSLPRLWVYIRDDSQALVDARAGAVAAGISKLEAGRIRIFNTTVSAELASKLERQ